MTEKPNKADNKNKDPEEMDDDELFGDIPEETDESLKEENRRLTEQVSTLSRALTESKGKITRMRNNLDDALRGQERLKRDFEGQKKLALSKFANDLLSVMDDLERALEHLPEEQATGVELTRKHLTSVFNKHGIKKIEALNKPFDPDVHEAITTVQKEGVEADTVVEEIQSGYTLNDKVLRPSRVKVSK